MPCLNKYLEKVKGFLENFDHIKLKRISPLKNDYIDALAKLASMKASNGNWSIMLALLIKRSDSMCVGKKES